MGWLWGIIVGAVAAVLGCCYLVGKQEHERNPQVEAWKALDRMQLRRAHKTIDDLTGEHTAVLPQEFRFKAITVGSYAGEPYVMALWRPEASEGGVPPVLPDVLPSDGSEGRSGGSEERSAGNNGA